jgi:polyhydroxyalkanoate synthesis repressor PhaR
VNKDTPNIGKTDTRIRRNSNRRLYCPVESRYITFDDVENRVISGQPVEIFDRMTGKDITRIVLMHILMRKEEIGDPRFTDGELRSRIMQRIGPKRAAA